MSMVTSERMRTVADTLSGLLWAGENVPIKMGSITSNPFFDDDLDSLESPGCVGCCYGLAAKRQGRDLPFPSEISRKEFDLPEEHYLYGAELMALDLGFKDKLQLKKWAEANPKLWGNKFGAAMFGSGMAYGEKSQRADADICWETSLRAVVKHLYGVADRLEAKEREGGSPSQGQEVKREVVLGSHALETSTPLSQEAV